MIPKDTPFEKELQTLVNRYSMENESDTPDFILAQYIKDSLNAFNIAVKRRSKWYGHEDEFAEATPIEKIK